MVMILGPQTENCIEACHEILKVVATETAQVNQSEQTHRFVNNIREIKQLGGLL